MQHLYGCGKLLMFFLNLPELSCDKEESRPEQFAVSVEKV
jgi:hypothetical protein